MMHESFCMARHDDEAHCECDRPTHIIYHGNCYDGFGAAFAAWLRYKDTVTYIPAVYGAPVPDLPADARVVMVDFAYKRAELVALARRIKSLFIIDHHKTAQADLADFTVRTHDDAPNIKAVFNLEHSGAVLAYQYFHGVEKVPDFFLYLEDRDLWRHKMPFCQEVHAALASYPFDFTVWNLLQYALSDLRIEGEIVLRAQNNQVELMCKKARLKVFYWGAVNQQHATVPVVNVTMHFSDVGNRLCELYPDSLFSVYYLDREDGCRQYGLRTVRDDVDVSAIAKFFGGGGHPKAAGFETPTPSFFYIVDRNPE